MLPCGCFNDTITDTIIGKLESPTTESVTPASSAKADISSETNDVLDDHENVVLRNVKPDGKKLHQPKTSNELLKKKSSKKVGVPTQIIVDSSRSDHGLDDVEDACVPIRGGMVRSSSHDEKSSKSSSEQYYRSLDESSSTNSTRSSKLEELRRKNIAIGLRRRQEISDARERHHPGALLFVPPTIRTSKNDDSMSISSFSTRYSTSSTPIVGRERTQSLSNSRPNVTLKKSSKGLTNDQSAETSSCTSSRSRLQRMDELAERNRQYASKRKEAIAKARAAAKPSVDLPSLSSRSKKSLSKTKIIISRFDQLHEHGKRRNRADLIRSFHEKNPSTKRLLKITSSPREGREYDSEGSRMDSNAELEERTNYDTDSSDRSFSDRSFSDRSTMSISRLDRLYQVGKQKNRNDLHKSIQDKEMRRNKSVARPNTKRDLTELSKRNLEVGRKRREDMARARAASNPGPRPLPKLRPRDLMKPKKVFYSGTYNPNSELYHRLQIYAME